MTNLWEGSLFHKGSVSKEWNPLWVVLQGKTLHFFKDRDNYLVGEVQLDFTTEVKVSKKQNIFTLIQSVNKKEKKEHNFKCESRSEREIWRAYIVGVAQGKVPSDLDWSVLLPGQMDDLRRFVKSLEDGMLNVQTKSSKLSTSGLFVQIPQGSTEHNYMVPSNAGLTSPDSLGKQLILYTWFFPNIDRETGEQILTVGHLHGNVLVRPSVSRTGHFVIQFRAVKQWDKYQVYNFLVQQVECGFLLEVNEPEIPTAVLELAIMSKLSLFEVIDFFLMSIAGCISISAPKLMTTNNIHQLGLWGKPSRHSSVTFPKLESRSYLITTDGSALADNILTSSSQQPLTASPSPNFTAAPTAPNSLTASPTRHSTAAPPTRHSTAAPPTRHSTAAPTRHSTAAPLTRHSTVAPPTRHSTVAPPTRHSTAAPSIDLPAPPSPQSSAAPQLRHSFAALSSPHLLATSSSSSVSPSFSRAARPILPFSGSLHSSSQSSSLPMSEAPPLPVSKSTPLPSCSPTPSSPFSPRLSVLQSPIRSSSVASFLPLPNTTSPSSATFLPAATLLPLSSPLDTSAASPVDPLWPPPPPSTVSTVNPLPPPPTTVSTVNPLPPPFSSHQSAKASRPQYFTPVIVDSSNHSSFPMTSSDNTAECSSSSLQSSSSTNPVVLFTPAEEDKHDVAPVVIPQSVSFTTSTKCSTVKFTRNALSPVRTLSSFSTPPSTPPRSPVPPSTPSRSPVPPSTPSRSPVPPSTPSRSPVPPSTPSRSPVPPSTPSRSPVPPNTPSRSSVPPSTPSRSSVPPSTQSRSPVPPSTPPRSPVPPSTPSRFPVPPSTPSRSSVPPFTPSRSSVPPNTPSRFAVPPNTQSRSPVPPSTPSRSPVPLGSPMVPRSPIPPWSRSPPIIQGSPHSSCSSNLPGAPTSSGVPTSSNFPISKLPSPSFLPAKPMDKESNTFKFLQLPLDCEPCHIEDDENGNTCNSSQLSSALLSVKLRSVSDLQNNKSRKNATVDTRSVSASGETLNKIMVLDFEDELRRRLSKQSP